MRRAGFLFIALFALLGCPSSDLSSTCHFEGETTACGKCIQSKCQSTIDSECDSIIRDDVTLGYLDKCASGKDCSSLFDSFSGNIGTCAKAACEAACTTTTATKTDATCPLGARCICCGSGSDCACKPYYCQDEIGTCTCESPIFPPREESLVDTCRPSGGGTCCLSTSRCECYDSSHTCLAAEQEVSSCTTGLLTLSCPTGESLCQ